MIHPWKKGFRPPKGFCPTCSSKWVVFTGDRDENKFHLYNCGACGANFSAPTFYAICEADNSTLEKDLFYTPCIHGGCTRFEPMETSPTRCKHFKYAQSGDLDDRMERALEGTVIKTTVEEKQPEAVVQSSGVDASALDTMRKERLKKLEGET